MPAPRAVLHDLAVHGLDPSKPHSRVAANGRLSGPAGPTVVPEPKKVEEKPAPKVEARVEKKPEPARIEPPKVEEKAPEQHVKAETPVEKKPVAKPVPVVKKPVVEKKEAPKVETPEAEKPVDDAKKA